MRTQVGGFVLWIAPGLALAAGAWWIGQLWYVALGSYLFGSCVASALAATRAPKLLPEDRCARTTDEKYLADRHRCTLEIDHEGPHHISIPDSAGITPWAKKDVWWA